jgi:oligo-1,6-glucosidase
VNAAADRARPDSIQRHYARLAALRRAEPVLVYGAVVDHAPEHPVLYTYSRADGDAACLVVLNFSREPVAWRAPPGFENATLLLSNRAGDEAGAPRGAVAGWEARVYRR